jgi:hypothetical protein
MKNKVKRHGLVCFTSLRTYASVQLADDTVTINNIIILKTGKLIAQKEFKYCTSQCVHLIHLQKRCK